jgi:hypothetical protein
MQKKWISKAIKSEGALRKKYAPKSTKGPRGGTIEKNIPASKLSKRSTLLSKKAKGKKKLSKTELTELRRINLAKTLRKLPKRGKK